MRARERLSAKNAKNIRKTDILRSSSFAKGSEVTALGELDLGLPAPEETKEEKAGRLALDVFKRWYGEYYVDRYTQKVPHIMKILKEFILLHVIEHGRSIDDVYGALVVLGRQQSPITMPALQFGLSKYFTLKKKRENAGANIEGVNREAFGRITVNKADNKIDYDNYEGDF